MKRKTLVLIVILLFGNNISAQENFILVDYTLEYGIVKNNEMLISNSNFSKYANQELVIKNDNRVKSEENEELKYDIFQKTIKLDKIETFSVANSNVIFQIQYKNKGKNVIIEDTLPNFDWKIINDQKKKIGKYECTKAICEFRGTKIVAYFAEELPFSSGPWKFAKLPGLILEVFTEDSPLEYHWYATNITYPFQTTEQINFQKEQYINDIISMKEYMLKRNEEITERNEIVDSRKPQGVTSQKTVTTRAGVEKTFEWE